MELVGKYNSGARKYPVLEHRPGARPQWTGLDGTGWGRTKQENWAHGWRLGLLQDHTGGVRFDSVRKREGGRGCSVHYHSSAHCREPLGVIYVASI